MLNEDTIDRLLVIAGEGSFARAAEALNVSRSALVQQVRQIEDNLGFEILRRDHRGVRPTEAGTLFLAETEALYGRYRDLVRRCAAMRGEGRESIVIGSMPNLKAIAVPAICKEFRKRFPLVEIRFKDFFPAQYFRRFRRGEFDICVENAYQYLHEEPGLEFLKLMDSAHCCAVLPGDPLAACGRVTFELLRGRRLMMYRRGITRCDDLLRDYIEAHEPEIGLIDIEVYDSSLKARCELENAVLLTYARYEESFSGFITIPTDWPFIIELGIGCRKDCRPIVRRFLEVAAEVYGAEGGEKA